MCLSVLIYTNHVLNENSSTGPRPMSTSWVLMGTQHFECHHTCFPLPACSIRVGQPVVGTLAFVQIPLQTAMEHLASQSEPQSHQTQRLIH